MKRSDSIGQIAAALAEAQSKFEPILKSQEARVKMRAGGEYSYKFADLAAVLDAVRPALNANGIALLQDVEDGHMVTMLVHASGEWLSCSTALIEVGEGSPQEIGSGLTYSRRYGICVALGVVGETDDDGGSAQSNSTARTKPHAVPERPNPRMDPMRSETQLALSAKMAEIGHVSTKEMVDFASLTMSMLAKKTIKYADKQEITQSDAEMILAELVRRYPDKVSQ